MVPPFSMDVTVGESIVLPCQVSHDHSLDIMFTWSFNGHLIDFEKDGDHFERVGGVSINIKTVPKSHSPFPLKASVMTIDNIEKEPNLTGNRTC